MRAGIFSYPSGTSFDALIHFTNGVGGVHQADMIPDARTMAIKLFHVPGPKLMDDERETQDFTFSSAKLFVSPDIHSHIEKMKLIGHPVKGILALVNPTSPVSVKGGTVISNPFNVTYYSSLPQLIGIRAAKFKALPCPAPLLMGKKIKPDAIEFLNPNYLRDIFQKQLNHKGGCFLIQSQLQVDADLQPIENAGMDWSEKLSPYVTVAKVSVPPQTYSTSAQREFCDAQAFNPWHSLVEHRPLGGLNRLRKVLYEESATIRRAMNHQTPRAM